MDTIELLTTYYPLIGLFVVAFLAATILPIGSEPLFITLLSFNTYSPFVLVVVATIGNSLGGILNYAIGFRAINWWAKKQSQPLITCYPRLQNILQRYGSISCLFAWLPIIGDVIPLIAGGLRLSVCWCAFYITIGKSLRYLVLTGLFQ